MDWSLWLSIEIVGSVFLGTFATFTLIYCYIVERSEQWWRGIEFIALLFAAAALIIVVIQPRQMMSEYLAGFEKYRFEGAIHYLRRQVEFSRAYFCEHALIPNNLNLENIDDRQSDIHAACAWYSDIKVALGNLQPTHDAVLPVVMADIRWPKFKSDITDERNETLKEAMQVFYEAKDAYVGYLNLGRRTAAEVTASVYWPFIFAFSSALRLSKVVWDYRRAAKRPPTRWQIKLRRRKAVQKLNKLGQAL